MGELLSRQIGPKHAIDIVIGTYIAYSLSSPASFLSIALTASIKAFMVIIGSDGSVGTT